VIAAISGDRATGHMVGLAAGGCPVELGRTPVGDRWTVSPQHASSRSTSFELQPGSPFRLDLTVWALRRRPDNAMDRWDGTTYRRVLLVDGALSEVAVTQVAPPWVPRLRVVVDAVPTGLSRSGGVIPTLEHLLGLRTDLSGFYRLAAADPKLEGLAARFRGVKPPRFPTVFEALLNAIACQQITLTQCIRLLNRLAETHGPAEPNGDPPHSLPDPADLARLDPEQLRPLGFSHQKARALVEAGGAFLAGRLDPDALENLDDAAAVARLEELRGVGRWSAEYVLLRGLGRHNVFPGDDVGARKNLARWLGLSDVLDYAGVQRAVAGWAPYAGLVYFHLLLDRLAALGYVSESEDPASDATSRTDEGIR
jgi:DNA-3-methyladenine glycosylase II